MGKGEYDGFYGTEGGQDQFHTITDNLPTVIKQYPLHEGYFGTESKNPVRHIESSNPVRTGRDFYDKLTVGAISRTVIPGGKGEYSELSDHSFVTFRPVSTSDGSPAADIKITKHNGRLKSQKIHFVKKGKNNENL